MRTRILLGLVGLVLVVAGVAKAVDGSIAAALLTKQTSSATFARAAVATLAGIETALGLLLLLRGAPLEVRLSTGLLVILTAWLVHLDLTLGFGTPCGCQVPLLGDRGWVPLARNAVLLGICGFALRRPRA